MSYMYVWQSVKEKDEKMKGYNLGTCDLIQSSTLSTSYLLRSFIIQFRNQPGQVFTDTEPVVLAFI